MIFERLGSDAAESVNHFMKSKTIAGNLKNTFGKIKYYIHLLKNQLAGKNLQGAVNNLQFYGNKLKFLEIVCRDNK